jgi:hypothetical protein
MQLKIKYRILGNGESRSTGNGELLANYALLDRGGSDEK